MPIKKVRKIVKRGKTERFFLNEKFIFGAPRCIRCGNVLKKGENIICNNCRLKIKREIF